MKIIETLCDHIHDEIKGAKCYAKMAIELKADYPELARTLNNMAEQEMDHMTDLHNAVVKIIADYRKDHGEPPADMLAVYNYLHGKHIEKAAEARRLIEMYKK